MSRGTSPPMVNDTELFINSWGQRRWQPVIHTLDERGEVLSTEYGIWGFEELDWSLGKNLTPALMRHDRALRAGWREIKHRKKQDWKRVE